MDKEFLNNLFLWLKEHDTDTVQFGNWDEEEIWGDTLNEYGMPEIIEVKQKPIEELYEIIDKPDGEKVDEYDYCDEEDMPEEYKPFLTHYYVDQWRNGGYTGDDYAGDLYFPLPTGKYMKIYYDC